MIPNELREFAFQVVDFIASAMKADLSRSTLADRFAAYAKHRLTLEAPVEPGDWWLEVESEVSLVIDACASAFSYQNPSERGNLSVLQVLVFVGQALPVSLKFHARLWFTLGSTAQQQHQQARAVAAYNESLSRFRQLELEYPGQFRHELATSLNNLGTLLREMGEQRVAREHYEEALAIYRQLELEYPGQFRRDVALTLNNLGNLLGELGEQQVAQEHYEVALEIYRQLELEYPGQFRRDIATTLNNLGNLLSNRGERNTAKLHYQEVLSICRQLDREYPGHFRDELATTLNNLGALLGAMGAQQVAKEHHEEAFEIYRQLDMEFPDLFRNEIAITLNNLGNLLTDMGQRQTAKEHFEEALEIYRHLDLVYPGQFRNEVAMTLNNLGTLLTDMGQRQAAKEHFEEALQIRQQLDLEYPGQFQNKIAMTLNNLGTLLSDMGQRQAAEEHYEEALEIFRHLDLVYPSQFRNEVAGTLNNLGTLLSEMDQRQAAEEHYEEVLEIYRQLDLVYPSQFRNEVAMTLNNLGNLLSKMGQQQSANEHYQEALQIRRQLDFEYTGQFRNEIAMTLNNLGNLVKDMGQRQAAKEHYEEALEIYRQLDMDYPGQFQSDVAMTLNNLGNLLSDMGQREGTKEHHKEALDIYRQNPRFSPENHIMLIRNILNEDLSEESPFLMREALEVCELMAGELRSFQDRMLWSGFATEFGTRLAFAAHRARDPKTAGLAFEHGQALSLKASVLGPMREKLLDLQAEARENPEFAKQEQLRELEAFIAEDSVDWTLPRLDVAELAIGWAVAETETLVVTYRGSEEGTVVESYLVPVGSKSMWEKQPNGRQVRTRPSWNGILRRFKSLSRVLDTCPVDLLEALCPTEVRSQIAVAKRVYLLPTGDLLDVPMRAIRLPDGQLLFRNATPSYPLSLDLMIRARKAPRLAGETPILFGINEYGDDIPVVDPDRATVRAGLSTLTHAVPEVEAVAGLHGVTPDKLLTDQDATLGRMKAEWWKSKWLHIAVHGEFNPQNVYKSRLFLYNENGVLDSITLGELMADRLRIQKEGGVQTKVVFLACCFGGKGTAIGGEGEVSIAYALLSNGVQCVVAAQWAAVDKVAHDLMIATHKHWLTGATIAESVHFAQVEVGKSTPVEHATVFNVFGDGTVRL